MGRWMSNEEQSIRDLEDTLKRERARVKLLEEELEKLEKHKTTVEEGGRHKHPFIPFSYSNCTRGIAGWMTYHDTKWEEHWGFFWAGMLTKSLAISDDCLYVLDKHGDIGLKVPFRTVPV